MKKLIFLTFFFSLLFSSYAQTKTAYKIVSTNSEIQFYFADKKLEESSSSWISFNFGNDGYEYIFFKLLLPISSEVKTLNLDNGELLCLYRIFEVLQINWGGLYILSRGLSTLETADYVLKWYRLVLLSARYKDISNSLEHNKILSRLTRTESLFKESVCRQAFGDALDNPDSAESKFLSRLLKY